MFEKEEQRSDELETSLKLADSWKKQGDELLYSMIPRPIAEKLQSGGLEPHDTCQSFDQVSIIFAEVEVTSHFSSFFLHIVEKISIPYKCHSFRTTVLHKGAEHLLKMQ